MLKKCLLILFLLTAIYLQAHSKVDSSFEAQDFSYLLGQVKGLDDQLLKMHFTLYQGYVKNAAVLQRALNEMREQGKDRMLAYGALERRFAWEYDGMILHEYYFENLGKSAHLDEKEPLYKQIVHDFGSFDAWKKNFAATGIIRGIGWVILYQEPKSGRLANIWIDDHHINHLPGGQPLLVMDVWEHAYITEFGLDRAGYIEIFLNNVNWDVVKKRYHWRECCRLFK